MRRALGLFSPVRVLPGLGISRPHGSVRYARPITVPLTDRTHACWIGDMKTRLDLTRRRHVDLARVSSAACCRVTAC
ncbi:putative leader peptide [Streptomyces sp. NPDC005407]|uniref:putative leader peptide n=1 Tax=Streptomyces sp. NPDC005407 TaxID=3155340 RepID=UPI0033A54F63